MIKEIKELENYVIDNKYEITDLLNAMQINSKKGYIYVLTNNNLKMMLNYIALLQKFSIKYFELKRVNKRSKNGKDKNNNLYK